MGRGKYWLLRIKGPDKKQETLALYRMRVLGEE